MTQRIKQATRGRWRLIVGLFVGVALALTALSAAPVGTYSYSCKNTFGHANGGGYIGGKSKNSKTNFEFEAKADDKGLKGHLRVRSPDGEFRSLSIDCFQIAGDSVILRATGLWNGQPGYIAYSDGTDGGNGHTSDSFGVTVRDSSDHPVFEAFGPLTGGDVNIHKAPGGNAPSGGTPSNGSGGSSGGSSGGGSGNPGGNPGSGSGVKTLLKKI